MRQVWEKYQSGQKLFVHSGDPYVKQSVRDHLSVKLTEMGMKKRITPRIRRQLKRERFYIDIPNRKTLLLYSVRFVKRRPRILCSVVNYFHLSKGLAYSVSCDNVVFVFLSHCFDRIIQRTSCSDHRLEAIDLCVGSLNRGKLVLNREDNEAMLFLPDGICVGEWLSVDGKALVTFNTFLNHCMFSVQHREQHKDVLFNDLSEPFTEQKFLIRTDKFGR